MMNAATLPKDVLLAASTLASSADTFEPLRTTLARAILSERERCAGIAEQSAAWGSVTAKRIAADIRRSA